MASNRNSVGRFGGPLSSGSSGDNGEISPCGPSPHRILQFSGDLICALDDDGRIVSACQPGGRILGYTSEELAGQRLRDLVMELPEWEPLQEAFERGANVTEREVNLRHKSGARVTCLVWLRRHRRPGEQGKGVLAVCRDVAAWKRLEEDLIRVDRLAEAGRLASSIIHEIKNPLAVIGEISGWSRAVLSDAEGLSPPDKAELETAVQRIGEQTQRCGTITHQFLNFVRESAAAKSSVDVNELLEETVTFLSPEIKFAEIEIAYQLEERLPPIKTDRSMLEQILINIISNAVYAVQQNDGGTGRIELKTAGEGPHLEITVSDTGIGISPEDQDKIFDMFYTTKPPGKGTGLGMPICRSLVEKLGGDISFESEPGKGSSFCIRLPGL